MTKHVPRHRLESLLTAGTSLPANASAHAHVAGCDACAVRKRAFDRARERYLTLHPPADFAAATLARAALSPPANPRWQWLARLWRWNR